MQKRRTEVVMSGEFNPNGEMDEDHSHDEGPDGCPFCGPEPEPCVCNDVEAAFAFVAARVALRREITLDKRLDAILEGSGWTHRSFE